jgi:D-alanyl-lipoteichoic acid acyltransferase DltB (MBOAT superfamily)
VLFNSATYLFAFLPATCLVFWRISGRARLWFILLASLVFYGFWRIEFIPLLLFSATLDYWLALWIERTHDQSRRRRLMLISVAVNLGILGVFKYLLFFRDTVWSIASWIGYHPTFVELNIVLPLGISFYIFATISYVIDVYRREFKAERSFLLYCCFVVFFPHLVAGPILRARTLIPQLRQPADFSWDLVRSGISRILQGLFLKVVLADTIAEYVNIGFAREAASLSAFDAWTLAFLFGFQIYFDFAGYSHIAIGSARLLGIMLPENFDFPYLATSPRDFWRRWHISLSNWVRDYVYIPMMGNLRSSVDVVGDQSSDKIGLAGTDQRTFSLYGTWALMGLWHGANWTFVIWGIYHATLVHAYRLMTGRVVWEGGAVHNWISRGLTLPMVMAGWVAFRSQTLRDAMVMWGKMLDPRAYAAFGLTANSYLLAAAMLAGMVVVWAAQQRIFARAKPPTPVILATRILCYTFLIMFDIVFLQTKSQFIYFQF